MFLRKLNVLLTIAMPLIVWYIPQISVSLLGVPISEGSDRISTVIHLWSVVIGIGIVWGYKTPVPQRKIQEDSIEFDRKYIRSMFGRASVIALIGGIVGALLLSPFIWWMAPLISIFGLMQMSMVGLLFGSFLCYQRE